MTAGKLSRLEPSTLPGISGLVPEIGEYAPIFGMKSAQTTPEAIKT